MEYKYTVDGQLGKNAEQITEKIQISREGWVVLDVKAVELTQERSLKDGSPYVSTYPKVIWVLGRFEEE